MSIMEPIAPPAPEPATETGTPPPAPPSTPPPAPAGTPDPESGAGTPDPETGTPAPSTGDDPFSEYGGRDAVAKAIELHKATQTDEGIVQLFFEAGRSLGLGVKDIERLFAGEPASGEPAEPEDLDRPLSVKEFKEMMAAQANQQSAAQKAQAEAAARNTVQKTITELGLKPGDETTRMVLEMGDRYLDKADLSPEAVANAVRRGHADYTALIDREAKAYLARKTATAASVPGAPSGASAPSAPPPEEPKDIAEAIRIARQRLRG